MAMSAQFQVQVFTAELSIISIPPEHYTFYFHGITKLILQSWEDDYLSPKSESSQEYLANSMAASPAVSGISGSSNSASAIHGISSRLARASLSRPVSQASATIPGSPNSSHPNPSIQYDANENFADSNSAADPNFFSSSTTPSSSSFHNASRSITSDATSTQISRNNSHSNLNLNSRGRHSPAAGSKPRSSGTRSTSRNNRHSTHASDDLNTAYPAFSDDNNLADEDAYQRMLDHVSKLKEFVNVSFTPVECSVICPTELVDRLFGHALQNHPATVLKETYLAIQVDIAGSNTAPTLLEITAPLSNAKIPIFFIPTHLSDFVLVPASAKDKVTRALKARGFGFTDSDSSFDHDRPHHSPDMFNTNIFNNANSGVNSGGNSNSPMLTSVSSLTSSADAVSPLLEGVPLTPYLSQLGAETVQTFQNFDVSHVIKIQTQLLLTGLRRSNTKSTLRSSHYSRKASQSKSAKPGSNRSTANPDKEYDSIFLKIVQALIHPPDFFSVTIVNDEEVSFIINSETAEMFDKDQLKGSTQDVVIPISFDFSHLPENATGIVAGVAFQLYAFNPDRPFDPAGSELGMSGTLASHHSYYQSGSRNSPALTNLNNVVIGNSPVSSHPNSGTLAGPLDDSESMSSSMISHSSHDGISSSGSLLPMQISYLSTAKSGVLMVAERDIPIATMALSVFSKKRKPGRGAGDKARVGNNGDSRGSGGGSGNRPGSGNGNDPRKMKRSSQVSESHVYGNESFNTYSSAGNKYQQSLTPGDRGFGDTSFSPLKSPTYRRSMSFGNAADYGASSASSSPNINPNNATSSGSQKTPLTISTLSSASVSNSASRRMSYDYYADGKSPTSTADTLFSYGYFDQAPKRNSESYGIADRGSQAIYRRESEDLDSNSNKKVPQPSLQPPQHLYRLTSNDFDDDGHELGRGVSFDGLLDEDLEEGDEEDEGGHDRTFEDYKQQEEASKIREILRQHELESKEPKEHHSHSHHSGSHGAHERKKSRRGYHSRTNSQTKINQLHQLQLTSTPASGSSSTSASSKHRRSHSHNVNHPAKGSPHAGHNPTKRRSTNTAAHYLYPDHDAAGYQDSEGN